MKLAQDSIQQRTLVLTVLDIRICCLNDLGIEMNHEETSGQNHYTF